MILIQINEIGDNAIYILIVKKITHAISSYWHYRISKIAFVYSICGTDYFKKIYYKIFLILGGDSQF